MITIQSIEEAASVVDNIDAAVFDLDDTLYSEREYVYSGFRAVADLFPQVPDIAFHLTTAFKKGLPAIDTVLEAYGLSEYKDTALMTYRSHKPDIHLYPGTGEMLRKLGQTKKLGLLTDGRPEGQRAKIQALGLYDVFDEIIITDELGGPEYRKPAADAFLLMHERMGVPFESMAYIGDNIKKDFISPENLGMLCVWFRNPDGLYYEEEK